MFQGSGLAAHPVSYLPVLLRLAWLQLPHVCAWARVEDTQRDQLEGHALVLLDAVPSDNLTRLGRAPKDKVSELRWALITQLAYRHAALGEVRLEH